MPALPGVIEIAFMERKYLFGLAAFTLAFLGMFLFTRYLNNTGAGLPQTNAATRPPAAGAPNSGGTTAEQQQTMGEVAKAVEKADNNPKDFDAQIEVAKMNYQIGRDAKTVEYLSRAYDADPKKLAEQRGALSYIGKFYFGNKKFDDAEKWFGRAMQSDADDLESKVFLSALKKDVRGAEVALSQVKQADPKNGLLPELEEIVAHVKAGKPLSEIKGAAAK